MSRLAAAQDALRSQIAARPALADVRVDLGLPTRDGDGPAPEHIWVSGDVADWRQTPLTTGATSRAREERFVLRVHVLVEQQTASYVDVRDRTLTLVGEVEAAIHSDTTLGGKVAWAELGTKELEEGLVPDGRRLIATLSVECIADLT